MNNVIKTIVFFLISIHVGISTCEYIEPTVTFSLDKSSFTKFPWMVIISNTSFINSYGSLVHPRAVLTLELHETIPKVVSSLRVYANCYFQGVGTLFNHKQDCSEYRKVATFNILENYQKANTNKVAVLSLSKPFVIDENIGVISLNQWERDISQLDCGILSIKSFKSDRARATFFSLTQATIYHNRTNINLIGVSATSHLILWNPMGQESYEKYKNSELELKFPGSPLICKSILEENKSQYVQVGIVNLTFKKYKRDGLDYLQPIGEVVRTDETIVNMQPLINKIVELAE